MLCTIVPTGISVSGRQLPTFTSAPIQTQNPSLSPLETSLPIQTVLPTTPSPEPSVAPPSAVESEMILNSVETKKPSQGDNKSQGDSQEKLVNDITALKEKNSDFVGWLTVPGTNIDYPVMQTNDNPDFYLRKNFYKRYSLAGTLYAEEGCDISTPSDNITIYGHHMQNGTMFENLAKYEDEEFYKEHKYMTFDTLDYYAKYEIVAVYKSQVYTGEEDEFPYWAFINAQGQSNFDTFFDEVEERELYSIDTEYKFGDKFLL